MSELSERDGLHETEAARGNLVEVGVRSDKVDILEDTTDVLVGGLGSSGLLSVLEKRLDVGFHHGFDDVDLEHVVVGGHYVLDGDVVHGDEAFDGGREAVNDSLPDGIVIISGLPVVLHEADDGVVPPEVGGLALELGKVGRLDILPQGFLQELGSVFLVLGLVFGLLHIVPKQTHGVPEVSGK